jgi:hypothetical protein
MSQALGLRRQILFLGVSGGPQRPRESNHREAEEEEKKSRLNTGTGTPRGHGPNGEINALPGSWTDKN